MPQAINAEVDRQLAAQRAQADSFASRSGVLLAATSLLTGFLAKSTTVPLWTVWLVGISSVLGVIVLLLGRQIVGPSTSQLAAWAQRWTETTEQSLLDSKIVAIEANSRAILRTEVAFITQSLLTAAAVASIVIHSVVMK